MKQKIIALVLALVLVVASCTVASAEGGKKKLTVMMYVCGSNLESVGGQATGDLAQILRSGYNENEVNVIALLGGSEQWRYGYDPDALTLMNVRGRKPTVEGIFDLESMADWETLSGFINYCHDAYPAEDYALIIWNHGGGPNVGVCKDDVFSGPFDQAIMSTEGIVNALENSYFAREKLSWIGFATCLQASVEIAAAMAPYADYMFASEETSFGWDYAFLKDIESRPIAESGAILCDRTVKRNAAIADSSTGVDPSLTMSVIDLNRIPQLVEATEVFFDAMRVDLETSNARFNDISSALKGTRQFGADDITFENSYAAISADDVDLNTYDLFDLGDLIDHLMPYHTNEAMQVRNCLNDAVIYHKGEDDDNYGLSIYHPLYGKTNALYILDEDYPTLHFSDTYSRYLKQFTSILTGNPMTSWKELFTILGSAKDNRVLFSLDLNDDQAEVFGGSDLQVWHREADGSLRRVFHTNRTAVEDNRITAAYDGTTLFAVDVDGNAVSEPLHSGRGGDDGILIPAVGTAYDAYGEVAYEAELMLVCSVDENKAVNVDSLRVRFPGDPAFTIRYNMTLDDFDTIRFDNNTFTEVRDDNGTLTAYECWTRTEGEPFTVSAEELTLTFLNDWFDTAELYAGFGLTDSQENHYTSEMQCLGGTAAKGSVLTSYDDMGLLMVESLTVAPKDDGTRITVHMTNINELEGYVVLSNVVVNGTANDAEASACGMGPNEGLETGETQMLSFVVDEAVTDLTFDLILINAADETEIGTVSVAVTVG
ncbi:MAG: clostripain-related cysteine peptidase [Clostridia bacterium]|nr:clostripain-related cysteine peptidase [Clostridia bacterium]